MASSALQPSWSNRVKGITSNPLQGDSSTEATTITANKQVSTADFPPLDSGDSKQPSKPNEEMADSQREEQEAHLKGKSWADMFDDDDDDDAIDEEFLARLNLKLEKKEEKPEEKKEEKQEEQPEEKQAEKQKEKTSKYIGGNHGTESSRWANAPDEPPRRSYYNNNNNRTYSNQYRSNYSRTQSNSNYSSYSNHSNSNGYNNNSSYNNNNNSYNNNNNNGYGYKPRADTSVRRSDEEADKIYNQLKNEIYGTPIPSSSPEPTRIRDTDNSAEAQKWNSYASTASSPTPAPASRWTNDRYQSEPSTPPTNKKWVNDMYDPSDKPSSTSRWANNNTSTGQPASASRWANNNTSTGQSASASRWANDRYQSEPSTPPTNRKWVNDMYDPSDKPSPSSRWANNTSTGQSTPTGRWTHDRYDPSEQAERSGNDKKSTWRIDISSTSSGDSTPTKWSQAGLHAENLPKNDGSDSPKQSNAPGNSELTLEQPANDSGRSTPQTNDAPAEHEAAGSQWSKYKTDSSASFNSPSREKEAPPKQETPGSQWNNDTSASFNNENRENDAPAKQETAGSQWNSYRNDSSTSFNNRSRESDSPAKQDTAGSQWNTYNTDSSTSFNNRDQSRGNTTRNHNNDKRGFNNADDKAFEQLKNEIYGTSTSTSTSASRTDDRNNQVKKHWEKDENDQWAPIGARDEATSDDTNSKWAKGNEGDCPPEITDKDAYMVKISNPEEGTHYWVKAYKPCLAMNSNWGDVFSTSSPAAQSPTVSSPAAPSPPPDPAASKWAQWAQKSS